MKNLQLIARQFQLHGNLIEIKPFGDGLINSTYQIVTEEKNYLLQKINHIVFPNVEGLSENIERITQHIRVKLSKQGEGDLSRKTLNIVYTINNKRFFEDEDGSFWRVFDFIEHSKVYDKIETQEQAVATGKAFAEFQRLLSNLVQPPLHSIIEGFHNTPMRIATFEGTLAKNVANRRQWVEEEIDFLLKRKEEMKHIIEEGKKGELPLRNVHQDAKLNNILFDSESHEILCVIDLDTTATGYICYDFGDAMRTGACTAKEDEQDLSKIDFDFEVFKSFSEGYMSVAKDFLIPKEIKSLAFGAKLITYEQAVRFLNDYLQADTYYRTEYPDHNLVRTRTQIKLLMKMEEKYDEMQAFIASLV